VLQRLQTVLLFIAFLLNGGVFFNAIYTHALNDPQSWIGISLSIFLGISALGSLGIIWLYNNRKHQKQWVSRLLIPQIITFGIALGVYVSLGGFGTYLWDETIGLALIFLAFIVQLYARKKIKDDIELVESMDRIR